MHLTRSSAQFVEAVAPTDRAGVLASVHMPSREPDAGNSRDLAIRCPSAAGWHVHQTRRPQAGSTGIELDARYRGLGAATP